MNRVLRAAKPALVILVDRKGAHAGTKGARVSWWIPKKQTSTLRARASHLPAKHAARFYDNSEAWRRQCDRDGAYRGARTAHPPRCATSLEFCAGPTRRLRDTYVLLTAHYDHLGVRPDGPGDRIYNGANDDGSGTVSVMEVARALARLPKHPRRSIVFMTFFGEEEGLIGSEYYAHHPVWPLDKTVADLNLEQVGRTDSTEGPQISNASLTGFDYSDLTSFVQRAGERTGIKIYKNAQGSDAYFARRATIFRSPKPACPPRRCVWRSIIPITTPSATSGKRSTTTTWRKWIAPSRWRCF